MSTENTPAVVHPVTGELVDVRTATPAALADALEDYGTMRDRLEDFREAIVAEVARRADARGKRTVELAGVTFEVNAPTEEAYDVGRLRAELEPLVADGTIDEELLDELIVTPPPKPQPVRVDRRRVAALKRSTEPRLLAAIARARTVVGTRRTAKVVDRAVEGTAR